MSTPVPAPPGRITALVLSLVLLGAAAGAEVPKNEYLRYVPLEYRKVMRQTEASARLQLFGDPADAGYRDQDPRDGVDDARMRRLQALGVRFAPLLVKNTPLFPMDFKSFWKGASFPLHVDTWDISRARHQLVREDQVDFARLSRQPCPSSRDASESLVAQRSTEGYGSDGYDDCRLLALLREFRPLAPENERLGQAVLRPEQELFTVMYFDFPGEGEESWKKAYWPRGDRSKRRELEGTEKVYLHPMIAEVRGAQGVLEGYELALQYWFFYPVNDGGNNHEGDWEHINVIVSPLSRLGGPLQAEEIQALLSPEMPFDGEDPVVMRRVEYYFHKEMYSMDFSEPNAYAPREAWERERRERGEAVQGEGWILERIRSRVWRDEAETEINTHPVGWIGGDGLGLAQLTTVPGGKDQDSHGTYPFQGQYRNVGPTSAGERVPRGFDHQAYLSGAKPLPRHVEDYASAGRIEVVPDWERLVDLIFEDPAVRREWAWMILPLRWGYPAIESPGAGIISNADTGNLSIVGPSFNEGWNRLGPANSYKLYEPHKLSWAVPLGVIDNFQPKAGFLNAPIALGLTLPPIDLIWRVAALPVRAAVGDRQPVFTPALELPRRTMSLEGGVAVSPGIEEMTLLLANRDQFEQIVLKAAELHPGASLVSIDPFAETGSAPYFSVGFHFGDRFTTENSIMNLRSGLGWNLRLADLPAPVPVRGDLNLWEYQGTFRFNLSASAFKPYVKAGYGLTWYRLEDVSVDGTPLEEPSSPWIRRPSFWKNLWPNTFVGGLGLDWTGVPIGAGLSMGLKAGYDFSRHRVGFEETAAVESSPELGALLAGQRLYTWRKKLTLELTLSY